MKRNALASKRAPSADHPGFDHQNENVKAEALDRNSHFCFRFFAQYSFMCFACSRFRDAFQVLFFGATPFITVVGADDALSRRFFGGLPLRFTPSWSAAMARFNLSRSWIKSARICSVGIKPMVASFPEPKPYSISN